MSLCTTSNKMQPGDRHALFASNYLAVSDKIKAFVTTGEEWSSVELALLLDGHLSKLMLKACRDEYDYWRAQQAESAGSS